jgi:dihydrofolate reductase
MTKVRVAGFSLSLDGFGAGPEQSIDDPLGKRGMGLHRWFFGTKTFRAMHGEGGGSEGVDEAFARRSMERFGAFILGRNMFGPVRGEWPDDSWKGWWGDNPPYHAPVFVLTHHARASVEMAGGTIFHFVTHGIEAALEQAKDAAGGRDVKIGGGVSTVRQYLQAGLIDEIHFAMAPVALGRGEAMFTGIDLQSLGFTVTERAATEFATHVVHRERGAEDIRARALPKVIDPTVGRPTPAPHLDGRCVTGKSRAMGDTAGNCLGRAHLALASNLFSVRAWWMAADLRILAQLDSKQKGRQTKRSPIGGAVGRIGEDRHAVGEVDAVADDQAHADCLGGLMGADDAGEAVAVDDGERLDAQHRRPIAADRTPSQCLPHDLSAGA